MFPKKPTSLELQPSYTHLLSLWFQATFSTFLPTNMLFGDHHGLPGLSLDLSGIAIFLMNLLKFIVCFPDAGAMTFLLPSTE